MRSIHVILPNDIDDAAAPSGGNSYDRRICSGLIGWAVHEHAAYGSWPSADPAMRHSLARLLDALPYGALVLVDGLIASAVPEVLVPAASRLRLVVLMHMPLLVPREAEMLAAVHAVVTTSSWTRQRLIDRYAIPPDRITVAVPGVDVAPIAPGSADGTRLLCVAAVTPEKGHDVLVSALDAVADLPWECACVGSLDRDPAFAASTRAAAPRVTFTGPLVGPDLAERYAAADLLVLASRGETYGMVVSEALARGVPVLATDVGGLSEALGYATGGRPGMLVPPDDSQALAEALRRWLSDADLRTRLRQAAAERRASLTGWAATVAMVDATLSNVALLPTGSAGAARAGSHGTSRVSVSR
jgi:glycosyltransferase involved in cell wall biosynthesis